MIDILEYKKYLKIASNNYDEELQSIIDAVETEIKEYLHSNIVANNYTEIYDGNGYNILPIKNVPINSVAKIEYYTGTDSSGNEIWETLEAGRHYSRLIIPTEKFALILDGGVFIEGIQNYRITYNGGYSIIPYDIQLACKELVKIRFDNSPISKNYLGITSINNSLTAGSESIVLDLNREAQILKKIERYKVYNV